MDASLLNCLSITWVVILTFFHFVNGHSGQTWPPGRDVYKIHNCGTDPHDWVGWRQNRNYSGPRCGVCGDEIVNTTNSNGPLVVYSDPLPHEYNGTFWSSLPQMVYNVGQDITVSLSLWNAHGGGIEWRICPDTKYERYNQSCFELHRLEVLSATDSRFVPFITSFYDVPRRLRVRTGSPNVYLTANIRLPAGLVCEHCVLQYTNLGSASQMFRTCSDIAILPVMNLQNEETGLCLAVNDTISNGLKLATCNATDLNQRILTVGFPLNNMSNRTIFFGSNRRCLDVPNCSSKTGALVLSKNCNTNTNPVANQGWSSVNVNDTIAQFMNVNSGMCLTGATSNITQTPCVANQTNQQWKVVTQPIPAEEPRKSHPPLPIISVRNLEYSLCLSTHPLIDTFMMLVPCNDTYTNQRILTLDFQFDNLDDNAVFIGSQQNCWDVVGGSWQTGAGVINYPCSNMIDPDDNQAWSSINVTESSLQFQNEKSGMCLTGTPSAIYQSPCDAEQTNQRWEVVRANTSEPRPDDNVPIIPIINVQNMGNTSLCLSADPKTNYGMILAACNASDPNQNILSIELRLNALNESLVFVGSKLNCLDVSGYSTSDGAVVINYPCKKIFNASPNQSWSTTSNGTSVQFVNKNSGKCLTGTTNKIYQNYCVPEQPNQNWIIVNR